jgi:hypothetical protein
VDKVCLVRRLGQVVVETQRVVLAVVAEMFAE